MGPESRVSDEIVEKVRITLKGLMAGSPHPNFYDVQQALEAVWPEPTFTPKEIKLAAAGMRSLLDGRAETHIADCDRCQQSLALLAKLEANNA